MNIEERMEIFKGIYQLRMSCLEIAKKLGRQPSSVSREIKRGSDEKGYNPLNSGLLHLVQRKKQTPRLKIDYNLLKEIKVKLEKRWSPQQISDFLKKSRVGSVSTKTIYNYINFLKEDNYL